MNRLLSTLVLSFLLLPGPALAGPHREIDVGAQSREDGKSFSVALCARESSNATTRPGHAFVAFSEEDGEGHRTFTAVGHTTHAGPARAILSFGGYLGAVEGGIEAEKYTDATEECLVINTSEARYRNAWRLVSGFTAISPAQFAEGRRVSLSYSLGVEDCMDMMTRVAREFAPSISVPDRGATEFPLHYVRRLIDEN